MFWQPEIHGWNVGLSGVTTNALKGLGCNFFDE